VAAPSSFDGIYRANAVVTAFFARRCSEPQTVADLTSETFLEAIGSFRTFDARKGSPRAWLFGIARHIYARHCAAAANGRQAAFRLAAQLTLDDDETEQLAAKIDDQRAGRRLLGRCVRLPEIDRAAIELVGPSTSSRLTQDVFGDTAGVSARMAGRLLSPRSERAFRRAPHCETPIWRWLSHKGGGCRGTPASDAAVAQGRTKDGHARPLANQSSHSTLWRGPASSIRLIRSGVTGGGSADGSSTGVQTSRNHPSMPDGVYTATIRAGASLTLR